MEKLRQLAPWQIILIAVATLLLAMIGGYFAVTYSSNADSGEDVQATVPSNLNSEANKEIQKKLQPFKPPKDIPQAPPLQQVNPNNPNEAPNPFKP